MKQLFLMRHAKSSWKDPGLADYDRPLSTRGERAAPFMGKELAGRGWLPELILTSTARRAIDTTSRFIHASGFEGPVICSRSLYHAAPDVICKQVVEHGATHNRVMVVSHNPGLEEWLESIGEDAVLPTAAVALLETALPDWDDALLESFRLREILLPRKLMGED